MEHPVPDFHRELCRGDVKKPGLLAGTGLFPSTFGLDPFGAVSGGKRYPRVRERIMKLSKVYSATCHQRYWSER
jgi:hypothetical protein